MLVSNDKVMVAINVSDLDIFISDYNDTSFQEIRSKYRGNQLLEHENLPKEPSLIEVNSFILFFNLDFQLELNLFLLFFNHDV